MVTPRVAGKAPELTGPSRARANTQLTGAHSAEIAALSAINVSQLQSDLQSEITNTDNRFATLKTLFQALLTDLVGSSALTSGQQATIMTYVNSL